MTDPLHEYRHIVEIGPSERSYHYDRAECSCGWFKDLHQFYGTELSHAIEQHKLAVILKHLGVTFTIDQKVLTR